MDHRFSSNDSTSGAGSRVFRETESRSGRDCRGSAAQQIGRSTRGMDHTPRLQSYKCAGGAFGYDDTPVLSFENADNPTDSVASACS